VTVPTNGPTGPTGPTGAAGAAVPPSPIGDAAGLGRGWAFPPIPVGVLGVTGGTPVAPAAAGSGAAGSGAAGSGVGGTAAVTGGFAWLDGAALVRQSILLILDTEPGERVMRPDFGCGLSRYLMEPNNPATRAAIGRDVTAALTAWEQRIELAAVDVSATDDPTAVLVSISYTHVRDASPGGLRFALTVAGG
jgi:phage baseplate assembly protein W